MATPFKTRANKDDKDPVILQDIKSYINKRITNVIIIYNF